MRLRTNSDESTNETKIPRAPLTTEHPPAAQVEALSKQTEPIKASREKAASPRPLGSRVAFVLASSAALFSAAAFWQAPAESRFTPAGFVEGATRATELVWYENLRIELAKKNLEAGRVETAAELLLSSSPTQRHNEVEMMALREKALLACVQRGAWGVAAKLALAKPFYTDSIVLPDRAPNIFWAEAARSEKYTDARKAVSVLAPTERARLMGVLKRNVTQLDSNTTGSTLFDDFSLGSNPMHIETAVVLSPAEFREWVVADPSNKAVRLKELVFLRGHIPARELLQRLKLFEAKITRVTKVKDETHTLLENRVIDVLKRRLIQDILVTDGAKSALVAYQEVFPAVYIDQKLKFMSLNAKEIDVNILKSWILDCNRVLEKDVFEAMTRKVDWLQLDPVMIRIGTVKLVIEGSGHLDEPSFREALRHANDLEDRRRSFLKKEYPNLK